MSVVGSKALSFLVLLFQEAGAGGETTMQEAFTISEMVKNLGWVALTVIVILLIMSMYSIAIMVERFLTYSAAKKQSREFAPRVAQALKNDRIEEAINISDKHNKSHLAMVVNAGLKSAESAGIGAVAGGIAEALIATAIGLGVAVPAVWAFNYFSGKVDGFIIEMDNSASELI